MMSQTIRIEINIDIEKLARLSYEAYGTFREWKTHDGKQMPQWNDLSEVIKAAWVISASTCVSSIINQIGNVAVDLVQK